MTFQGVPPRWRGRCSVPRVWVILRDTNSTGVSVLSFLPSGFVLSSYFWLERLAYCDCSFITSRSIQMANFRESFGYAWTTNCARSIHKHFLIAETMNNKKFFFNFQLLKETLLCCGTLLSFVSKSTSTPMIDFFFNSRFFL